MLKNFTFRGAEDSIWWTSDTHFHHKPFVFLPRQYNSQQEHDEGVIHKWNEVVKNTDTVIFLGDFILSVNKAEDSLAFLRRLNYKTFINIWGNHNASLKQLYFEEIKKQYNLENVEIYPLTVKIGDKEIVFVGDYLECFVNGQHIINHHFSLRTWHKNGKNSWACVGHSHKNDKGINPDAKEGKILDVGIDNFGRPINFRELKNIMNSKEQKILDHHGADPVEE